MTTVTKTMRYRQALIKYAEKYGVTKAAIRYKTNRQYIYRWKNRYDGTLRSLADKSHRPHHHPSEHTEAELKLIADIRRRNPHAGLVVFWVKLMQRGYTRSITGLYDLIISYPYQKLYYENIARRRMRKFLATIGDIYPLSAVAFSSSKVGFGYALLCVKT